MGRSALLSIDIALPAAPLADELELSPYVSVVEIRRLRVSSILHMDFKCHPSELLGIVCNAIRRVYDTETKIVKP